MSRDTPVGYLSTDAKDVQPHALEDVFDNSLIGNHDLAPLAAGIASGATVPCSWSNIDQPESHPIAIMLGGRGEALCTQRAGALFEACLLVEADCADRFAAEPVAAN